MQYLQDKQSYVDRYDLHTIEECLKLYWDIRKGLEAKRKEIKNMTQKKFDEDVHKAASFAVRALSIERYKHRAETIQKRIDEDTKIQEKYDNATAPAGILCKECNAPIKISSKDLLDTLDENSQVLFMFRCTKCNKGQAFYEDGTEWKYKPRLCPKCGNPLNSNSKDKDDVSITLYTCPNCPFTEKSIYDFKKSKKEREEKEIRDKNLLAKYRDEFCLNEENGPQALQSMEQLQIAVKHFKEKEEKDKSPLYQKVRKLKSLKITELKELIEKAVGNGGYKDLQFGKPEMGQFVIIDFTANEPKNDSSEFESRSTLKKLMETTLKDTNWRLMSEGISYRLGILSGRLKAYEREEDLVELISKKTNQNSM